MYAARYFAGRYFPRRYFPAVGSSGGGGTGGGYFPKRYFAKEYFPGRYFPVPEGSAPVPPTPSTGGGGGGTGGSQHLYRRLKPLPKSPGQELEDLVESAIQGVIAEKLSKPTIQRTVVRTKRAEPKVIHFDAADLVEEPRPFRMASGETDDEEALLLMAGMLMAVDD